jgi:hypothetical protein
MYPQGVTPAQAAALLAAQKAHENTYGVKPTGFFRHAVRAVAAMDPLPAQLAAIKQEQRAYDLSISQNPVALAAAYKRDDEKQAIAHARQRLTTIDAEIAHVQAVLAQLQADKQRFQDMVNPVNAGAAAGVATSVNNEGYETAANETAANKPVANKTVANKNKPSCLFGMCSRRRGRRPAGANAAGANAAGANAAGAAAGAGGHSATDKRRPRSSSQGGKRSKTNRRRRNRH